MSSFTVKRLRATLVLSGANSVSFTSTGNNTLVMTDNRMSARVLSAARQAVVLNLRIWGMKLADMDAMTAAWQDPKAIRNNAVILESDDGRGFKPVFSGTILEAQPDFRSAPDVPFQVFATIRYFKQIQVVEPVSYKGAVDISVLGQYIADQLGMSYKQSPDLKATLTDPCFPGSIWTQLNAICKAAHAVYYFQGDTLFFAPVLITVDQKPTVVLTPDTGLIGYPMYSRRGLVVTAIYDPAFLAGAAIEIQDSLVKGANGRWYPFSIEHTLEANLPGGKWISVMQCNKRGT